MAERGKEGVWEGRRVASGLEEEGGTGEGGR